MLEELQISGIGVIERTTLRFDPGFTVITGETGAGKTMVLTGLGLLLGGRADQSLVRRGHENAQAEAVLTARNEAELEAIAAEAGGSLDDGALLVGRVVPAEGRARASIAGRSVPTAQLAEVLGSRVTVHGQSDQLRLRSSAQQRGALDSVADLGEDIAEYRRAFEAWRAAAAALADWEETSRRTEQEQRILQSGLEAIDALNPQPGEDDELRARAAKLANVEDLRAAVEQASYLLGAEDSGAAAHIDRARRALETMREHSEFGPWAAALTAANSSISEVLNEIGSYREALEADPAQLEQIFERRAALTNLMRTWGPSLDDVIVWAESARARLAELAALPTSRVELEAQVAEALQLARQLAGILTARRTKAAKELTAAVNQELSGLAMPGATFGIALTPVELGPFGADEIAMTLSPHPGAAPLPVAKSASGGELSRIMLALEVCLAPKQAGDLTMVFDEVDAGIGGAAAVEIGARLAKLARTHQVIVVTHLAQVAAFADRHLVVRKEVSDSNALTDVSPVAGAEREQELARMLAGDDSSTARLHAAELLERAGMRR